jgi:hypothetical protein
VEPVACAGVPRDLGVAQGRAWDEAVRDAAGAAQLLDAVAGRTPLETHLWRHHPQLAERTGGIAVGAKASGPGLFLALGREAAAEIEPVAALAAGAAGGPAVLRSLSGDGWIVRRSEPEAGIPALELTRAWLAPALAGVNAEGLAVAASGFGPAASGAATPGFALVQDCLSRFAAAEGAIEWCCRRPAGGRGAIVAVDAAGVALAVEIDGDERSRVPESEILVVGGAQGPREALAKALREGTAWTDALSERAVRLEPVGRRLRLRDGGEPQTLALAG